MLYFQQQDPAPNGVDIWQTTQDRIRITHGADHLAALQLSPKGVYRWYARCCNTPLTTTLRFARLPLAGFLAARFDDPAALGPTRFQVFMKQPDGSYKHQGFNRIGARVVRMMIAANLSGRWRNSPFFKENAPIAPPTLLSREARAAFY